MRNEIFKQIQQNRKRYYAELSSMHINPENEKQESKGHKAYKPANNVNAVKIKMPSVKIDKEKTIKSITQKAEKINSGLKRIFQPVSNQLSDVNSKIANHGQKLSDEFYKLSSSLFEDQFQEVQIQENGKQTMVLNLVKTKQLVWDFELDGQEVKIEGISVIDRMVDFKNKLKKGLKKIYFQTVLFFELDPGIEEMNSRKDNRSQDPEKKEILIDKTDQCYETGHFLLDEEFDCKQEGNTQAAISKRKIEPALILINLQKLFQAVITILKRYYRII
jgi:hypothetical protein